MMAVPSGNEQPRRRGMRGPGPGDQRYIERPMAVQSAWRGLVLRDLVFRGAFFAGVPRAANPPPDATSAPPADCREDQPGPAVDEQAQDRAHRGDEGVAGCGEGFADAVAGMLDGR